MIQRIKAILHRILYPGAVGSILIGISGILVLGFIFIFDQDKTTYASTIYPFVLYSLVVLILGIPNIAVKTKALISKNKYGKMYLTDPALRARVALYRGLFVNMLFVFFYTFMSWRSSSLWFGGIAAYYFILSLIRLYLFRSVRKVSLIKDPQESLLSEIGIYRTCGFLMIALNMVMSGMVIQMIWQNKGYEHSGWTIYTSAIYAFYCLISAIIDLVKYHKMNSPLLAATKIVSFAGALMSMLALQTAMLSSFGAGKEENFRQKMNLLTGSGVLVIVFALGIFMVIRATFDLKKAQIKNGDLL